MSKKVFVAVDLGASSGRHVAGLFDGSRLTLEDIHRFGNGPVPAAGHLYWDVLGLWQNIVEGLRLAGREYETDVASVGVDTWGVDFALLNEHDELVGNPFCYRDPQTVGTVDQVVERVGRDSVFEQTGVQFMEINTLYQLFALAERKSPLLSQARTFLMIPDLFHWLLTGEKANEFTDTTTTQMYNPVSRDWAYPLLESLNIPRDLFAGAEIVPPGTRLGKLRSEVADATGLSDLEVVLPGTHDTASAVMAVPTSEPPSQQPNWCYISSGTWSLMGVETPQAILSDKCRELNFTNEGGVGSTLRVLKNITGLWIIQECRRIWHQEGRDYDWSALVQMAMETPRLASVVNPDHPALVAPSNMPEAIRKLCRESGQPIPDSEGAVIRCGMESLALKYRQVLGYLEELTGSPIETIHILGGGTQNKALCQMTADACNRHVVAGPIEATAIGNVMMQAVAAGEVASIAQAREIVRTSFSVDEYQPSETAAWNEAYERFEKLTAS
ncbi:MAG: rhamnulokinase [Pirellulales bacterium]|nr:rhamnulokinase [Pirellulales bacterium]